jgi:uncharacterized protein (DUF362 family)
MENSEQGCSRRSFIRTGAYACAVGLPALSLTSCDNWEEKDYPAYHTTHSPLSHKGPASLPPTRVYPAMDLATVGMAHVNRNLNGDMNFESVLASVREAIEAAGGLSEIESGQRVMIKPNMAGPLYIPGKGRVTTDPLVVQAVIRLVKERGAHAMVGDRGIISFLNPSIQSRLTYLVSGIGAACKEENAEPYHWHLAEYVRFHPNKQHWSEGFRMPKILQEVDHFINVPILKNHEGTTAEFTCCLKSYVGVIHPEDRQGVRLDRLHMRNISEKIAEANLCIKPLINIVDATNIMVRGGPGSGMFKGDRLFRAAIFDKADLVIASKDRVACESISLSVLKLHAAEKRVRREYVEKSVWDQVQIYYAAQLGLGQAEPDKITIEDIKVPRFDEIKDNWV